MRRSAKEFGMRFARLFVCLLLLRVSAFAAGTVGFNVTWYPTAQFLGLGEDCPITGGVVIADFNRDGIRMSHIPIPPVTRFQALARCFPSWEQAAATWAPISSII